jgi:hypothetical protein
MPRQNVAEQFFDQIEAALEDCPPELLDWPSPGSPEDESGLDLDSWHSDNDILVDSESEFASVEIELSDEVYEQCQYHVRARGIDALAFYKSKRFLLRPPFPGKWGVFFLDFGLRFIEEELGRYYPGSAKIDEIGRRFLLEHELTHFKSDIFCGFLEIVTGRNLFETITTAMVGRQTFFVEEAIANQRAYEWAKKAGVEEFAFDFMSIQPNTYRRFTESINRL